MTTNVTGGVAKSPALRGGEVCTKTCELGRVGAFYQVPNINHKGWYEVNHN